MATTLHENNAGGMFILARDGLIYDVTAMVDDHGGVADLLAADEGDTDDWTVPTLAERARAEVQALPVVADYAEGEISIYVHHCGRAAQRYLGLPDVD